MNLEDLKLDCEARAGSPFSTPSVKKEAKFILKLLAVADAAKAAKLFYMTYHWVALDDKGAGDLVDAIADLEKDA